MAVIQDEQGNNKPIVTDTSHVFDVNGNPLHGELFIGETIASEDVEEIDGFAHESDINAINQSLAELQTFAGNFKWQDNGAFSQLVQDGQTWLLFGNRPTAAGSIILIVNNYNNGTITVTEVLKSTSYTYETNNLGTVNLKYSNNTNLVASFAIRIK